MENVKKKKKKKNNKIKLCFVLIIIVCFFAKMPLQTLCVHHYPRISATAVPITPSTSR